MTTFTIAAGADDGYSAAGAFSNTAQHNFMDGADDEFNWFRFSSVTIPQGSTITSAVLNLEAYGGDSDANVFRIEAFAEDDATNPANHGDEVGRSRTSATVDWSMPAFSNGVRYNSPDISTVVQEIVGRAGWSSGNHILIGLKNTSPQSGNRGVQQYDSLDDVLGALAATLTVTWTAGGTTHTRRKFGLLGGNRLGRQF